MDGILFGGMIIFIGLIIGCIKLLIWTTKDIGVSKEDKQYNEWFYHLDLEDKKQIHKLHEF